MFVAGHVVGAIAHHRRLGGPFPATTLPYLGGSAAEAAVLPLLEQRPTPGMHAVPHRITPTDVGRIVAALDPAGVDAMSSRTATDWPATSLNYGSGSNKDWEWIQAAAEKLGWAVLTTLPLSGIRTIQELEHAYSHGVRSVRVATHCTEADVARHIATATSLQLQR
jgi:hypothetical protein